MHHGTREYQGARGKEYRYTKQQTRTRNPFPTSSFKSDDGRDGVCPPDPFVVISFSFACVCTVYFVWRDDRDRRNRIGCPFGCSSTPYIGKGDVVDIDGSAQ
jgi:hypothetical protein